TYVVVYTIWLKRRSSWNIVIGGFAGSAPVLAGSAAAAGHWTAGALALALLVFLWTPPHFWSLAVLLREDYARARLPMLPNMEDLALSGKVIVVSAALLVPAGLLVGLTGTLTAPALAALLVIGGGLRRPHLASMADGDCRDRPSRLHLFRSVPPPRGGGRSGQLRLGELRRRAALVGRNAR
ncbi:UbiA prenyltransferase, partial [mine drainage metagenome]